jgi:hypothetical protein
MKNIVGLSGFGDSIYLEPLARREIESAMPGEEIAIHTNHPDVFAHLPAKKLPYNRKPDNAIKYSYLAGKANPKTTQLEDMGYVNTDEFMIKHSPIALLVCGYPAMGSQDDLVPEKQVVEKIVAEIKAKGYQVLHIGNGSKEEYKGATKIVSINYFQTVAMFKGADLIVCQQGWGTAMAEGLNKKCLVIFSHNFRTNHNPFLAQITPDKVCCKKSTFFMWDNEQKALPDEI